MGQRKYLLLLVSLAGMVGCGVPAQLLGDEGPIGLVLERSLFAPDIFQGIEGAKVTVLVPGRRTSAGVNTFTDEEWAAEKLEWPEVMTGAMEIADQVVASLKVEWERDENGVILFGEVRSEDPFLGSAMFSKRFLEKFRAALGPELLVVVPEQARMYLFPRFGGKLDDFGASLAQAYQESALKVSLEVFLVDERGCRVIGVLGSRLQN